MAIDPLQPSNIFQTNLYLGWQNQVFISTFHFRIATIGTDTDVVAFCEAVNLALKAPGKLVSRYKDCISQDIAVDYIQTQRISPQRTVLVRSVVGEFGSKAQDQLTGNVAGVITFRTDLAGRDQVGGLHVPIPTAVDSMELGKLAADQIAQLQNLANGWVGGFTTALGTTCQPVIYHRSEEYPLNWSLITAAVVQDTSRVMRRRTVRVGI